MLNLLRYLFPRSLKSKSDEDYWKSEEGTKIIYQRGGRHFLWDGKEEKEINLKMSNEKE